jgi:hypothetical protein
MQSPRGPSFDSGTQRQVGDKITWRRTAGWWLLLSVPGCIVHLLGGPRIGGEVYLLCLVALILGLRWLLEETTLQPGVRFLPAQWGSADVRFLLIVFPAIYLLLVALFIQVQPPPATCSSTYPWDVALWGALAADLLLVFPFFAVAWIHVRRKEIPTFSWQLTATIGGGAMALTRLTLGGLLLCLIGMIMMPDLLPFLGDRRNEQLAASRVGILLDGFLPNISYALYKVIPRLSLHPDEVFVLLAPLAFLLSAAARAIYEVRRMWASQFNWRELPPWPFR